MMSRVLAPLFATAAVAALVPSAVEGRALKQFATGSTASVRSTGVSTPSEQTQDNTYTGTIGPGEGNLSQSSAAGNSLPIGTAIGNSQATATSGSYSAEAIAYDTQEASEFANSVAVTTTEATSGEAYSTSGALADSIGDANSDARADSVGEVSVSRARAISNSDDGYAASRSFTEAEGDVNVLAIARSDSASFAAPGTGEAYSTSEAVATGLENGVVDFGVVARASANADSFAESTTKADATATSLYGPATASVYAYAEGPFGQSAVGTAVAGDENAGGPVDATADAIALSFGSANAGIATASGSAEAITADVYRAYAQSSSSATNNGK